MPQYCTLLAIDHVVYDTPVVGISFKAPVLQLAGEVLPEQQGSLQGTIKCVRCGIYWGDYVFLQNNRIENQWLSGARGSSPNNGVVTGDVKNKESHAENRSKWKIMSD